MLDTEFAFTASIGRGIQNMVLVNLSIIWNDQARHEFDIEQKGFRRIARDPFTGRGYIFLITTMIQPFRTTLKEFCSGG